MVNFISGFNPAATGNVTGGFAAQTRGFIQGAAIENPTTYGQEYGGVLATAETIPMWGGVAIYANIPPAGSEHLGQVVGRALTNAAVVGFSVYEHAGNAILLPGGGVPLLYSGQKVSYFKLGSNQRMALQIDPALVSQDGSLVTTQFSWDFTMQRIGAYSAAYAQQTPSAYTSYNSSTGVLSLTFTTAPGLAVGEYASFGGFTGSQVGLNTDMPLLTTASAGTVLTFQGPTGLGSFTPANGYLLAGGGALGLRSVDVILPTGNKIITYAPTTGAISWNESGAIAVVTL
jgi:hypothetical protein